MQYKSFGDTNSVFSQIQQKQHSMTTLITVITKAKFPNPPDSCENVRLPSPK